MTVAPCRLDPLLSRSPPKLLPFPYRQHVLPYVPDGCSRPSFLQFAHLVHADSPSLCCSLCSSGYGRYALDLPVSVSQFRIFPLNPLETLRNFLPSPAARSNASLRWLPTWLRLFLPSCP